MKALVEYKHTAQWRTLLLHTASDHKLEPENVSNAAIYKKQPTKHTAIIATR